MGDDSHLAARSAELQGTLAECLRLRERAVKAEDERDRLRAALDYLADGNASAVKHAILRAKLNEKREVERDG